MRVVHASPCAQQARVLLLGLDRRALHACRGALEAGRGPAGGAGVGCEPYRSAAELERAAAGARGFAVALVAARALGAGGAAGLAARLRALAPAMRLVLLADATAPIDRDGYDAVLSTPLRADAVAAVYRALALAHAACEERDAACARLEAAVRIGDIGHWQWSAGSGEALWCPGFARLADLPAPASGGDAARLWARVHPEDRERLRAQLVRCAGGADPGVLEYRVIDAAGAERRLRQLALAGPPAHGGPWVVCAAQDVSERRGVEDTIRRLAYFDPLTELPNRSYLNEHLRSTLVQARRHGRTAALLHVNLDGFKRINDTLGHGAGDRLLQEVALRLEGCVRDGDCVAREQGTAPWSAGQGPAGHRPDTVTRFAADEFIVVLSEVASSGDPERVAERVIARLREPVALDGREVTVSASVGIAVFPDDAAGEDVLLRNAALAMQCAKRRGRNSYQRFHRSLLAPAVDRLDLEASLRQALRGNGLALHYQPKVEPLGGRVAGAEALLRWEHPELGAVAPSAFIPIAEESGLILPLGEWVVHEVCRQLAAWRAQGLATVPVSINVSARQLHDRGLVRKIRRELESAGIGAAALEFEITESMLMEDTGAGEQRLRELQALGSLVSMDDFGTGYSSLSYLKRLPIDVVKIDRSFVRDILREADDQAILRAIITMAHQLRLRIVAEGVESEQQMRLLQEMGCDLIQGYVVSRPLPPGQFARRFLCGARRLAG